MIYDKTNKIIQGALEDATSRRNLGFLIRTRMPGTSTTSGAKVMLYDGVMEIRFLMAVWESSNCKDCGGPETIPVADGAWRVISCEECLASAGRSQVGKVKRWHNLSFPLPERLHKNPRPLVVDLLCTEFDFS